MEECQNQVKDQLEEEKLFFCLVTKEFLDNCPVKCPYYVQGPSIPMDLIYQHNLEMECPNFHLIACLTPQDQHLLICGKSGDYPDCSHCPLVRHDKSGEGSNSMATD